MGHPFLCGSDLVGDAYEALPCDMGSSYTKRRLRHALPEQRYSRAEDDGDHRDGELVEKTFTQERADRGATVNVDIFGLVPRETFCEFAERSGDLDPRILSLQRCAEDKNVDLVERPYTESEELLEGAASHDDRVDLGEERLPHQSGVLGRGRHMTDIARQFFQPRDVPVFTGDVAVETHSQKRTALPTAITLHLHTSSIAILPARTLGFHQSRRDGERFRTHRAPGRLVFARSTAQSRRFLPLVVATSLSIAVTGLLLAKDSVSWRLACFRTAHGRETDRATESHPGSQPRRDGRHARSLSGRGDCIGSCRHSQESSQRCHPESTGVIQGSRLLGRFSGKGEVEADQDLGAQVRAVVGLDEAPRPGDPRDSSGEAGAVARCPYRQLAPPRRRGPR